MSTETFLDALDEDYAEELKDVDDILRWSNEHHLTVEVVLWGLKNMQEDPTLTPVQALFNAYNDWVK